MRSRRTMYLCLLAAVGFLLLSLIVAPSSLQLLLSVLAVASAVLFALVLTARRQDPNGPPGQH
jgi:hypothetical protein